MPQPIFSAPAPTPPAPAAGPETRPMLHASTRIATPDGPQAVETLKPGDTVLTHGGDPATLRAIGRVVRARSEWAYTPAIWPLRVPVGVLGNDCPLRLSPGMRVLLPDGSSFARMGDLTGIAGVARDRPLADLRYFELHLPDHSLILAEGAPCESVPNGPRLVRLPLERDAARRAFAKATGYPGG